MFTLPVFAFGLDIPFPLTVSIPKIKHYSAPKSTGNTFQDLPRLRETADNTERYI
jgi:hypothetical protein